MRKLTITLIAAVATSIFIASSAWAMPGPGVGSGLNADWSLFRRHHHRCCKRTCCENKCNSCNKCGAPATTTAAMPAEGAKCGVEASTCGCENKCGCDKCGSCNKCRTRCHSRCGGGCH